MTRRALSVAMVDRAMLDVDAMVSDYSAMLPRLNKKRVAFTILGEPASKANSRQVVRIKGRPAVIKSRKALSYEMHAALQIPTAACVMFTEPVRVTMRIYYATERPDLDESVVLDVLQARFSTGKDSKRRFCVRAGVYVNDRQVREKHIFHAIDRKNPRAEIEVEEIA